LLIFTKIYWPIYVCLLFNTALKWTVSNVGNHWRKDVHCPLQHLHKQLAGKRMRNTE